MFWVDLATLGASLLDQLLQLTLLILILDLMACPGELPNWVRAKQILCVARH